MTFSVDAVNEAPAQIQNKEKAEEGKTDQTNGTQQPEGQATKQVDDGQVKELDLSPEKLRSSPVPIKVWSNETPPSSPDMVVMNVENVENEPPTQTCEG